MPRNNKRPRNNGRGGRRRRRGPVAPGGYPQPVGISPMPRYASNPSGHLTMSHEELFVVPKVAVNGDYIVSKPFCPGASGMPMLDAIGKIYERYALTGLRLHWRTSVGTQTAGAVIVGVDGDPTSSGTTMLYAQSLIPKFRGPVWEEGTIVGNPMDLMPTRWLCTSQNKTSDPKYTSFLAVLAIANAVKDTAYGEVWCQYTVTFAFPASGK